LPACFSSFVHAAEQLGKRFTYQTAADTAPFIAKNKPGASTVSLLFRHVLKEDNDLAKYAEQRIKALARAKARRRTEYRNHNTPKTKKTPPPATGDLF
jgi:hypothetical protein